MRFDAGWRRLAFAEAGVKQPRGDGDEGDEGDEDDVEDIRQWNPYDDPLGAMASANARVLASAVDDEATMLLHPMRCSECQMCPVACSARSTPPHLHGFIGDESRRAHEHVRVKPGDASNIRFVARVC